MPPTIASFTSDLSSVPTGGQTILHWQADGDLITLEELTVSGTTLNAYNVQAVGERAIQISPDLAQSVTFRLTARRGLASASKVVTITIQCSNVWFFSPGPSGCPSQPPYPPGTIKYQSFELGIGFYVSVTNNVYLLTNAGNRVNAYPLDAGYAPPAPLTPPGKLVQPQDEIGYIWLTKRWSDGSRLDGTLGWATAPIQVYSGQAQLGSPTSDLYFPGPNGAIYKLSLAGTGAWAIVSGGS